MEFDWRGIAATCFIGASLFILLAWQAKPNKERGSVLLLYAATSLDALGIALTLYWAINATDGFIMPMIFSIGFVGMLIAKAVMIPQIIDSTISMNSRVIIAIALCVAYCVLYSTGLFTAVNDSGDSAQKRFESSVPAKALDAEIEMVRQRISSLASFADANKAHEEQQAIKDSITDLKAKESKLESDLQTFLAQKSYNSMNQYTGKTVAGILGGGCPSNAHSFYVNEYCPTYYDLKKSIQEINSQLINYDSSGYTQKHNQYNGLQAHLVELQKERAALSENGQGIKSMWKPEDTMLAWIFGISEEKASQIKWLVLTFIFDFLSLMFRIIAALIMPTNPESERRRKIRRLIDSGVNIRDLPDIIEGKSTKQPNDNLIVDENRSMEAFPKPKDENFSIYFGKDEHNRAEQRNGTSEHIGTFRRNNGTEHRNTERNRCSV